MFKSMIALVLFVLSFSVFADDKNEIKLEGEVVAIHVEASTFDIKDANNAVNTFKVSPATEFETKCETCMIMKENILPVKFNDLKVGDRVKVKYKGDTVEKIANDVKIYKKG